VINLGALPQPPAGFAAASRLQAPQEPGLATQFAVCWKVGGLPLLTLWTAAP